MKEMSAALRMRMYKKKLAKSTKPQSLIEVGDRGLQDEGVGQKYEIYILVFAITILDLL